MQPRSYDELVSVICLMRQLDHNWDGLGSLPPGVVVQDIALKVAGVCRVLEFLPVAVWPTSNPGVTLHFHGVKIADFDIYDDGRMDVLTARSVQDKLVVRRVVDTDAGIRAALLDLQGFLQS